MDAKELTELAMEKSGETSVRTFAKRLGVSHVAVGYWLAGTSVPTFEQAAELAALAGLPIIKTASEVRLHSPAGMKHRSILMKLAGAAVAMLVLVGAAHSYGTTGAALAALAPIAVTDHLYIMRNGVILGFALYLMFPDAPDQAFRRLAWIWMWITSCLPPRSPRKDEIEA